MSAKGVELVQRAERGARVAEIRKSLGMTGEKFAEELTRLAAQYGVQKSYDRAKVSRIEGGGRLLTVEELALLLELDDNKHSLSWLVFGDPVVGKRTRRPGTKGRGEEDRKTG